MELDETICGRLLGLVDLLETMARDKLTLSLILDSRLGPEWRQEFEPLRADPEVQKRITAYLADILELRSQWVEVVSALRRGEQPHLAKGRIQ